MSTTSGQETSVYYRIMRSLHWDLYMREIPRQFEQVIDLIRPERVEAVRSLIQDACEHPKDYGHCDGDESCESNFLVVHCRRSSQLLDSIRHTCELDVLPRWCVRSLIQYHSFLQKNRRCDVNRSSSLDAFSRRQKDIPNFLRLDDVRSLRRIIAGWLGSSPNDFDPDYTECRHGPGVTADEAVADDKWEALRRVPPSLVDLYKKIDPLGRQSRLAVASSVPGKLFVVPKNWKGGRIIVAEQTSRQFVQQWIGRVMSLQLRRRANLFLDDASQHVAVMRRMNETPQPACTIDLSEASDLVSMSLVAALFPKGWLQLIAASRSPIVTSPETGDVKMKSCASMGNGFCFSVLSTVCAACCAMVTGQRRGGSLWSVFGDDIVIDDSYHDHLRALLTRCGLAVNDRKTFRAEDPFCETCGTDLWRKGLTNVTPFYFKADLESGWTAKTALDLTAAQRYAARHAWYETAKSLVSLMRCSGVDPAFWPVSDGDYPGHLNRFPGFDPQGASPFRWNRRYQRREVLTLTGKPAKRKGNLVHMNSFMKVTFNGGDLEWEFCGRHTVTYSWSLAPA